MTNLPEVQIAPELLPQNRTLVKHQINHRFVPPEEATLLLTHEPLIIPDHHITAIPATRVPQIQQPDQAVLPEGHNPVVFLTTEIINLTIQITDHITQDHRPGRPAATHRAAHRVHQDRPAATHPAAHQVQAAQVDHPVQAVIHQAGHPAQVEAQAVVQEAALPDLQVEDLPEVHDDNCKKQIQ